MVDTAQARAEAALRRDATLEAVAFAAQRFLESPEWEQVVPQLLRRLGDATEVSRVYIFQQHPGDEDVRAALRFEWTRAGVERLDADLTLLDSPLVADGFGRWLEILGRGDVLHGVVRDFPESERRHLEPYGVRSILVAPIHVERSWWGYIGFDDCANERQWSQIEIDALRAAAGTIGAAIARRQTEEQLRQAEERYRAIVERTPVITYQEVVDDDYEAASSILYVSPQVERLLGYPAERWWQVPGFWTQIVHPDDVERATTESERSSATGQPYNQDYRMISADGRIVWFHDEAVLLRDESGKPTVWQGVMIDVTEAKRAEEKTLAAEAKYRALVENIPAVTYRQTPDGDPEHFYVSPQVEGLVGYTPQEWTWTPNFWFERIHPDDRARVAEADRETDLHGTPFDLEYRLRRADGSYVWIHDQATLVRQEDGPDFWQGFMMDVSERKRAEEALQEAEERYRTLVEQVPAAIYTQVIDEVNPDVSKTVYISPQTEALIGYSVEESLADPELWRRIVHPDDRDLVWSEDAATNRTGDLFQLEYRVVTKDGRTVWIRDEASLIRDAEGRPRAWQGFMLDITERKAAEEQLERALDVEREATQRLRTLDEMKNTFLQAVSHDLRTPLAAILGLAVTLERADLQLDADEAQDLARRIAANARKLDRMVSDLLDLDRLARGIVHPKRLPTDVGALIRRVVGESDLFAQGRVSVEAPSLEANVDAPKVERIVENLLANTARHTPPGTQVWVRLAPAHGGLLLAVEDEGPGIPAEAQRAIFEPFRQGPGAPDHSPGVGIGLTLVARFAELLGGRAWVEDREGGGASFRVFLADEAPEPADEPAG